MHYGGADDTTEHIIDFVIGLELGGCNKLVAAYTVTTIDRFHYNWHEALFAPCVLLVIILQFWGVLVYRSVPNCTYYSGTTSVDL